MTTVNELLNQLSPERRAKVEARAAELIAEEMTLQDLRKARVLTQERIAQLLGINQDSVSRLEHRSDLLLSTLRSYIAALGGRLELIVQFPDRPPVALAGFSSENKQSARRTRPGRSHSKPLAVQPSQKDST
ncbi:MAG: XRE family transcriptional regulator [Candidatus Competibacteraceae bacterium]